MIDRLLNWFIRIWIVLMIGVHVAMLMGVAMTSHSLLEVWYRITIDFNPLSVGYYILEVVLWSPALVASAWLNKRKTRGHV